MNVCMYVCGFLSGPFLCLYLMKSHNFGCRGIRPAGFHERIKSMYSWMDVTNRTITVYNNIAMMRRCVYVYGLIYIYTVDIAVITGYFTS